MRRLVINAPSPSAICRSVHTTISKSSCNFLLVRELFSLESQHAITELPSPPSDVSSNPSQRPNPKSCLSFLSFKTPCTTITQTPANMSPTHERNLYFHTETAQDQSRNSGINHHSCSIDWPLTIDNSDSHLSEGLQCQLQPSISYLYPMLCSI